MNVEHEKDLNKMLQIVNNAVYACEKRYLLDIEEKVLLGSLRDKTYKEIAEDLDYSPEYISRDVGFKLWKILTIALGEKVSKKNHKASIRRAIESKFFS